MFGPVSWAHAPLFLANKALGLSAVVLFACAMLSPDGAYRGFLGRVGLAAAGLHGVASVLVLRPAYLDGLFGEDGMLSAAAELAMIVGLAAFATFVGQAAGTRRGGSPRRWGLAAASMALVGGHATLLGWDTWLRPASWHGGLPPITLLGALVATATLALRRPEGLGGGGSAGD